MRQSPQIMMVRPDYRYVDLVVLPAPVLDWARISDVSTPEYAPLKTCRVERPTARSWTVHYCEDHLVLLDWGTNISAA